MAGQKTQRRVNEFAKQTANQYYYMMLTEIALQSCIAQFSQLTQWDDNFTYKTKNSVQRGEDVDIILSGQDEIVVNKDVIEMMERDGSVHVAWSFDNFKKMGNKKFNLKRDLVRVIHRRLVETKKTLRLFLDTPKQTLSCLQMNKAYSTHIHSIKDTIGMTGQWYIFEKKDKLGNSFDSLYPSRFYLNQW